MLYFLFPHPIILQTKKARLVPWTNNSLAYFFHGFDERGRFVGTIARLSKLIMEREARGIMVELHKYEDGGRLRIVDKSGPL
jgi:hypothetical protein